MAGEITHIVFAEKLRNEFPELFLKRDFKRFIIGTTFPDIRYLGVIERNKTHLPIADLAELWEERNDFFAGLKYHNWLDLEREKFMVKNGIYACFPDEKYVVNAIKLVEDKRFYEKINNWPEIISLYEDIPEEEKTFSIDLQYLRNWHQLLRDYFLKQPDLAATEKFVRSLVIDDYSVRELLRLMPVVENNKKAVELIDRFGEMVLKNC